MGRTKAVLYTALTSVVVARQDLCSKASISKVLVCDTWIISLASICYRCLSHTNKPVSNQDSMVQKHDCSL